MEKEVGRRVLGLRWQVSGPGQVLDLLCLALVQPETDFHIHLDRYRNTVLAARFELPLADRLERLLIEPHAERTNDSHIVRSAPYDNDKEHHSAGTSFTGFFRELRIRCA